MIQLDVIVRIIPRDSDTIAGLLERRALKSGKKTVSLSNNGTITHSIEQSLGLDDRSLYGLSVLRDLGQVCATIS
jgi:hypothetical protein